MRKILLVDDSKAARYAMRNLLQKHECEVDPVESAEAALERVKENPPDAIFMDHMMPNMNGFEALDALKADAQTAHIPVVMCTANDDEAYQIEATGKGALGILSKPAKPEKLEVILKNIDSTVAGGSGGTSTASGGGASSNQIEQLSRDFEGQIAKLREDLKHREEKFAQSLINKIAKEILPTMLRQAAEQVEQRILQKLK